MENRRSLKIKNKKSKRKNIFLKWIVLPLLIIIISTVSYSTFLYSKAQTAMNLSYKPLERNSSIRETAVNPTEDNISILFIGVDDSEERKYKSSARSDALILATFNVDNKSVKLLSIPRDSYVNIPGKGKDKITHAHSYGGPATTIKTVENLLEVPVDFYVKMNFNAFVDIIDSLGGINFDVPYAIDESNSAENKRIRLQPGLQKLNGEQALAVARTRKQDSDIMRGKRQMEIIQAVINKVGSAGSISKYDDVIEAVGKNMTTDLSFNQMTAFINYVAAGSSLNIETISLDGHDLYLENDNGNSIYYYQLDEDNLESIQTTLKSHLDLSSALVSDEDDAEIEDDQYSSINK